MKPRLNNIDKKLEPKGDLSEKIRLADLEKNLYDAEQEILRTLKEDFEKESKPGTSFLDWLKSKDDEYFKRIKLRSGGFVSKAKIKEPVQVKKIDLTADMLETFDKLSKLSDAEREVIRDLLNKSFNLSN